MVFFNYALRKLNAKIVYYGPGLGGKTTNLQWIHDHFEGGQRGKMISLATEGDRTIFFDLLPIDIGTIRGMDVTLQLYTVPGQVHYNSTRQLVLRGADGVVFVADSQRTMGSSNVESFENLQENLMLQGIDLKDFPHALQFNKRDLRDLISPDELNESLNIFSAPIFEAIATEGIGVQETLEGIVKLVMRNLREKYEPVVAATGPQVPAAMGTDASAPSLRGTPESVMVDPPVADEAARASDAGSVEPSASDVSVEEAMQDIDSTHGMPVFKGEDEIPTSVYAEIEGTDRTDPVAAFDDLTKDRRSPIPSEEDMPPVIAEDGPTPVFGVADGAVDGVVEEEGEESPAVPGHDVENDVVEVTDEPPMSEAEPADLRNDLITDPDYVPGGAQPEIPAASTQELFELPESEPEPVITRDPPEDRFEAVDETLEQVAEDVVQPFHGATVEDAIDELVGEPPAEPVAEIPQTVAPAVASDRFEDRIEAPGPFAPKDEPSVDLGGEDTSEFEQWDEEVDPQVIQALGVSEDREALASLRADDDQEVSIPSEVMPAPPSDEDEAPPGPADTIRLTDEPQFEPEPVVDETPVETPETSDMEAEPPVAEIPSWEAPAVDPSAVTASTVGEVEVDPPADDTPSVEPLDVEPPVADVPVAEAPEIVPLVEEAPAVEPPEVEAPDAEAPDIEPPAVEPPLPETPMVEPPPVDSPVPPPPAPRWRERSQPIVVGSGDPFAPEPEPAMPEIVTAEAALVRDSRDIDVTAADNQLHLQFKGSGAIAEMGQVRALDIEVPVPGQWVGNRKVTLQLRLTLTPAEDIDD